MTVEGVEAVYQEFYGRMRDDLKRDIDWQREHPNERAANVLCALALVVYTEALGRISVIQEERRVPKKKGDAFYTFLDRMGGGAYRDWRKDWETRLGRSIYDQLRNGLVHEYMPKGTTKLWFYFGEKFGLGEEPGYDLVLKMEAYYNDFCETAEELFRRLRQNVPLTLSVNRPVSGLSGPAAPRQGSITSASS